jgi:deazaflavin-dependent oxidoreductase (nitroreductase family)
MRQVDRTPTQVDTTVLEEIMADSNLSGASDFNTKIVEEFRANEGRVGGSLAGTTIILIHHVGAKSGIERVSPLGCSPRGAGRFAIVASNGGSPAHPGWYYNLKANAEELDNTARAELWPKFVADYPHVGEFQTRTTRQIPVFVLTRQD